MYISFSQICFHYISPCRVQIMRSSRFMLCINWWANRMVRWDGFSIHIHLLQKIHSYWSKLVALQSLLLYSAKIFNYLIINKIAMTNDWQICLCFGKEQTFSFHEKSLLWKYGSNSVIWSPSLICTKKRYRMLEINLHHFRLKNV